jgi:hypothetical protein
MHGVFGTLGGGGPMRAGVRAHGLRVRLGRQLSQMGITDDEVQQLCAAPSRSASVASLASSSWRLAFEVKALPPNERTGSPSAEALIAFARPVQQIVLERTAREFAGS